MLTNLTANSGTYESALTAQAGQPEAGVTAPTAAGIAAAVRSGQRSAVAFIEDSLSRIAEANTSINAFVEVRGNAARQAAAAIDEAVARGESVGPLAGVPVAIKDSLWESGHEATAGSRALVGFRPPESAAVVERLVSAGAIVVGRTNLPEFCYRGDCSNDLYGTTVNPWSADRTPGGSSGGAAAAVAAGMVPIAIGSDGGGSIRIPASFCGIVGLKPTFGRVPRTPGWPGWYELNHLGPLTATVEDAALALSVIEGADPRDPTTHDAPRSGAAATLPRLGDLRIAYSEDLGYIPVDDRVRDAFRATIDRLKALGANLTPAHPPVKNPLGIWNTLTFADNVASEGDLLESGLIGSDAELLIRAGMKISGADYARARNARHAFTSQWEAFMADYDLMLTPTMECVAFPHIQRQPDAIEGAAVVGDGDDWCHFCYAFNLTGQPAVSVPSGQTVEGLPVGLQIVGKKFTDRLVLGFAAAWERANPWRLPELPTSRHTGGAPNAQKFEEAVRMGRHVVRLPGEAGFRAGQLLRLEQLTLRICRSYRPDPTCTVVEFENAAGSR
ncbi:amidase [Arthrobacter sp. NPDC056493]|uniref:amidase n=1 Tax=Arthrobacter sp. NPDC056493 TaxID=3345839 RepID=UPI00366BF288